MSLTRPPYLTPRPRKQQVCPDCGGAYESELHRRHMYAEKLAANRKEYAS